MSNLLQNHSVTSDTRYLNTRPDDPVVAGRKLAEKHVTMFRNVVDKYSHSQKTQKVSTKAPKSNARRKTTQNR